MVLLLILTQVAQLWELPSGEELGYSHTAWNIHPCSWSVRNSISPVSSVSCDYMIQCKTLPQGSYLSLPTSTWTLFPGLLPPGPDCSHHFDKTGTLITEKTRGRQPMGCCQDPWSDDIFYLICLSVPLSLFSWLPFSSCFYFSLSTSHLPMHSEGRNYNLMLFMNHLKFVCGL